MSQIALESAAKAARWLVALLKEDGSLQGATDLRAYYKTPAAFINNGYIREADLMLGYVERAFLRAGGDLVGEGVPWFESYRTYPHAWLCVAAMMRGRFELAFALRDFIAGFHDPASGGFHAEAGGKPYFEIMTTSMAGLACLWSGRADLAEGAGNWLRNLLRQQPDLGKGLYTSCGADGKLITDQPGESFLVDPAKPRQWYFQYGISAALLCSLGDAATAQAFLHASRYAYADRYQTPQSGKIGWGAAWTYRLSKDPRDLALVNAVAAGLCALQNDDGSWLATGVYGGSSAEADSVTIDVTAEFASLQSYMGMVTTVLSSS